MLKFKESRLRLIAQMINSIIKERTTSGIDKFGKSFKEYSTKPFKTSYKGFPNKGILKQMVKSEQAVVFENAKGYKMVLVKIGYADYKKQLYAKTNYSGKVNLTLSGRMLQDQTVLRASENTIIIGFNNRDMAKRVAQNISRGRDFLGLPNEVLLNDPRLSKLIFDIGGLDI